MRNLLPVAAAAVLFVWFAGSPSQAGPPVDVVVAGNAPRLEKYAADELAAQFKQLFDANIRISDKPPAGSAMLVLIGSPDTNPAVKRAVGDRWPKLSDQGLVIRSIARDGGETLVVGGGSPVATLWAVYELGHRFGVRYLLGGDVFPAEPPPLKLDKFDVLMEPTLRMRAWRTIDDSPIGHESWGLAEHQRVLRQLAKLKFNRVILAFHPRQPFVQFEIRGVPTSAGDILRGQRFRVDGDTAGRSAFNGASEFTNPDFAGKNSYAEKIAAGTRLARGVIDAAHELGMSAGIQFEPLAFPLEVRDSLPPALLKDELNRELILPGDSPELLDDPRVREAAAIQLRAYMNTYPGLDAVYLRASWGSTEPLRFIAALCTPELLGGPDGRRVEPHLKGVAEELYPRLEAIVPKGMGVLLAAGPSPPCPPASQVIAQVPARAVKSTLEVALTGDVPGVLPQIQTRYLHARVADLQKHGWDGFVAWSRTVGEIDPGLYFLSRASFDPTLTPDAAYSELVTPMCGEGVAGRLTKGFDQIEEASPLIEQNQFNLGFPKPLILMQHYTAGEPPPAWMKEVRDLYAGAMDEMYRSQDRSHVAGRPFLRYYAKRLEFAYEYMSSIEATRLAGQAKKDGDSEKQIEHLEKAVEAMYNALNAYGEVARDSCDRGVIAVLNEYGYRPLKKELEAVSQEAERHN